MGSGLGFERWTQKARIRVARGQSCNMISTMFQRDNTQRLPYQNQQHPQSHQHITAHRDSAVAPLPNAPQQQASHPTPPPPPSKLPG